MSDFQDRISAINKDWSGGNAIVLYGLIRSMRPETVVEVGTYLGYSAVWMAQALKENGAGHLYCIDNFSLANTRNALESNLCAAGVRDFITILDGDSDKVAWPNRVDFAYVDGWHSYLMARHDFSIADILEAECICVDDTTTIIGPRLLMQDVRYGGKWDVLDIMRGTGLTVCMRKKPLGPITFSQELPDNPGVDLQRLTKDEQLRHLEEAHKLTGVSYLQIVNLLCAPK